MLHHLTAGSLLAWFVILATLPQILLGQNPKKQGKANESKISKQEAKVAELEKDYYDSAETAKADLLARMDSFISYVSNAPGIAVDLRVTILDDLREAKSSFDKYSRFTAIPAFQGIYQNFALTLGKKYWSLMSELDKLRSEYPAGDNRCEELEKRVKTLSDHYTHFDSLKPGSKWNGYRSDFKMPPRMELNPEKMGQIGMFRKVQDTPVNVEFSLSIEKRSGARFSGLISQNEGSFQAYVDGTYDGIVLQMWMVKMKEGAKREFRYLGKLVGGSGFLQMDGIKTNGAFTRGTIYMTLQ